MKSSEIRLGGPKVPGTFLFMLNGTVIVYEVIKYLISPLTSCIWYNVVGGNCVQLFSAGKNHIIFRGNLTEDFRGTKMLQIDSCRNMMESRLTLQFRYRIQNPQLISLAHFCIPLFPWSLSELVVVLGPVPKALYKDSVFICWGMRCLKDYHLNKVPFIMVNPATKMMFHTKLHVDFISVGDIQ